MAHLRTKLEDFSIEIFLEIFDYLSIDDCFRAFDQLHWKMNSALESAGFAVNLTSISSRTYRQFYEELILSQHTRQIRKLQISNVLTLGLIEHVLDHFDLRDFSQLRSLTLIKPSYMTLSTLALLIPQFEQLEHLAVDSHSYPEHFFRLVTTKSSSIKSCYLPGLEIDDEIDFQSSIECLTITVEDIMVLCNLLAVFNRLKYLKVILRSMLDFEENSLPDIRRIHCLNLERFHLYLLQRSSIDFHEMEYFFRQISLPHLTSFSYNCVTNSLNHLHVSRWNEILVQSLSTVNKFDLFVQIPINTYSYTDIQRICSDLQTNLSYSCPFSLAIHSSYYIIYTNVYPRTHFELSINQPERHQCIDYDPINCEKINRYGKVNSLILNSQLIFPCTIFPKTTRYLHIQDFNHDVDFSHCLQDCVNDLLSLKIAGLPDDLPCMAYLRELTIQQCIFDMTMAKKLPTVCPSLEVLTVEIDCIDRFDEIFDQIRYRSNLTQLKFLRVFSRDPIQTWTCWLRTHQPFEKQIHSDVKNAFLFLWF